MFPVNTWTFLLLLCINLIVYCNSCIWLQDSHKDLPKKMLNNFQHMIPENETSDHCLTNRSLPDTRHFYKISQVESAAITVRELFYLTLQFYTKHQEKLVSSRTAWEQLQEDLYHQANLLKSCISRTTEEPDSVQKILHFFNALEKILEEQDDVCARRIIHIHIKRNLLQAAHLSALMRRHFRKTPK